MPTDAEGIKLNDSGKPALDRAERIAGCMLGGAVGDALGASVEFLSLDARPRRSGSAPIPGLVSQVCSARNRAGTAFETDSHGDASLNQISESTANRIASCGACVRSGARDLASFGIDLPAPTMRRFWMMLAHYHGQLWNSAELARNFGVAEKTVRRYLDILVSTFMAQRLEPWHENISKRQVKAPRVFLGDSGLLHALLGIDSLDALLGHPKLGASWEGFVMHQVLRRLGAEPEERFFWALHTGAELDLLVVHGRTRLGFEIKRTDAPRLTPSMRSALENLRLDRLDVVHAGAATFPLADGVRAFVRTATDGRSATIVAARLRARLASTDASPYSSQETSWQGHVGFFVGESPGGRVCLFGGNQSTRAGARRA